MKRVRLTISLPWVLHRDLKREAKKEEKTLARHIQHVIEEHGDLRDAIEVNEAGSAQDGEE